MNYEQEKKLADEFFGKAMDLLVKKANDYAKDTNVFSNFEKIGYICDVPIEKTFVMFMVVKLARIIELLEKSTKTGESLFDSLLDTANYACLMYMYLQSNGYGKDNYNKPFKAR